MNAVITENAPAPADTSRMCVFVSATACRSEVAHCSITTSEAGTESPRSRW